MHWLMQADCSVADDFRQAGDTSQNQSFIALTIHRQYFACHAIFYQQHITHFQPGNFAIARVEGEGHAVAADSAKRVDCVCFIESCNLWPEGDVC
ncbi:MAG: hypothetical protein ABI064_04575 [Acidobacteriaceae bacterium]